MSHKSIIPDLACPVCFEIPQEEVYQCRDGHILCSTCYFRLPICPQCRAKLDWSHPIRNRPIEEVLQLQMGLFSCRFRGNGCPRKLPRCDVDGHQDECCYDFAKFGKFVNICKKIGFPNCTFEFNNGNVEDAVSHFISQHGTVLKTSERFKMELTGFKMSALTKANRFNVWTPIIVKNRKCYVLLLTILNERNSYFAWLPIFLPYPGEISQIIPVLVEYKVQAGDTLGLKTWIETPISLAKASKILPNLVCSLNNALKFIPACSDNGSLMIECNFKKHKQLPFETGKVERLSTNSVSMGMKEPSSFRQSCEEERQRELRRRMDNLLDNIEKANKSLWGNNLICFN